MGVKRDVQRLLVRCEHLGCTVVNARHYKVRCPNGRTVIVGRTVSDSRALMNVRAALRRIGELDV